MAERPRVRFARWLDYKGKLDNSDAGILHRMLRYEFTTTDELSCEQVYRRSDSVLGKRTVGLLIDGRYVVKKSRYVMYSGDSTRNTRYAHREAYDLVYAFGGYEDRPAQGRIIKSTLWFEDGCREAFVAAVRGRHILAIAVSMWSGDMLSNRVRRVLIWWANRYKIPIVEFRNDGTVEVVYRPANMDARHPYSKQSLKRRASSRVGIGVNFIKKEVKPRKRWAKFSRDKCAIRGWCTGLWRNDEDLHLVGFIAYLEKQGVRAARIFTSDLSRDCLLGWFKRRKSKGRPYYSIRKLLRKYPYDPDYWRKHARII